MPSIQRVWNLGTPATATIPAGSIVKEVGDKSAITPVTSTRRRQPTAITLC